MERRHFHQGYAYRVRFECMTVVFLPDPAGPPLRATLASAPDPRYLTGSDLDDLLQRAHRT